MNRYRVAYIALCCLPWALLFGGALVLGYYEPQALAALLVLAGMIAAAFVLAVGIEAAVRLGDYLKRKAREESEIGNPL